MSPASASLPEMGEAAPATSVGPSEVAPVEAKVPRYRGRFDHALAFRRDPLGTLLRWQADYGEVVRVRLRRWTLLLNHPADVKQVLVAHQGRYHKGVDLQLAASVFGRGLLTSEGELHLLQRRLMQPAFHRDALRSYGEVMVARSLERARAWTRARDLDLHREMMGLTLEIAAKTMFGLERVAEAAQLSGAIETAQEVFRRRLTAAWPVPEWVPSPTNLKGWRSLDVMNALVLRILDERRAHPGGEHDLLSFLLEARNDEGLGMSDAQLRDEALTLLLAGHETTAGGLAWTFDLLARHPEVQDRVREELGQVLGGRPPTVEDLPRLGLLDRVFSEALRLYPSAWLFSRLAMEDDRLPTGTTVPAGGTVLLSPWTLHRSEKHWPDPTRFDPERFQPAARDARPPFAYFPFGGGTRRCIGEPFAKMEAALVLATILQRLSFAPVPGATPVPEPLFTLRPKGGVHLKVRPVEG